MRGAADHTRWSPLGSPSYYLQARAELRAHPTHPKPDTGSVPRSASTGDLPPIPSSRDRWKREAAFQCFSSSGRHARTCTHEGCYSNAIVGWCQYSTGWMGGWQGKRGGCWSGSRMVVSGLSVGSAGGRACSSCSLLSDDP